MKHFFHTQKRTYNPQSTTKKQILLLPLIFLLSIRSLPKPKANRNANCFDQNHSETSSQTVSTEIRFLLPRNCIKFPLGVVHLLRHSKNRLTPPPRHTRHRPSTKEFLSDRNCERFFLEHSCYQW